MIGKEDFFKPAGENPSAEGERKKKCDFCDKELMENEKGVCNECRESMKKQKEDLDFLGQPREGRKSLRERKAEVEKKPGILETKIIQRICSKCGEKYGEKEGVAASGVTHWLCPEHNKEYMETEMKAFREKQEKK